MTRSLIAWRTCAALLAGLTVLVSGCGGGGGNSGGNANLRALNATTDLQSIDVYTDADNRFPNVGTNAVTSTQTLGAVSYTVRVTSAGDPTSLFSGIYSLSKDKHYTAVVWGRNGSLKVSTLPEDEDTTTIATGNSRVRVFNGTADVGAFDVYLTSATTDLDNATPAIAGTASGALTAFADLSAGTYRLRITAAGAKNNKVRLDVPAITLTSMQYATIIITAGMGGTLVNAGLLVQQGDYTPFPNTNARLRVVPGVESSAVVSVQVDGQVVADSLVSPPPLVQDYQLVPAGSRDVNVLVNGSSVLDTPQTFTAGADYSLLVYGPPAAVQTNLIADDNRLPATGFYKMRLVNGASTAGPVTLQVGITTKVSNLPVGQASDFVTGVPGTVTVSVKSLTNTYFTNTYLLDSLGIYTLFMLGGGTAPTGVPVGEP
jgi:hypothetical protein